MAENHPATALFWTWFVLKVKTMTNKEKKHAAKVSRLLAMVLRHGPEKIGLTLDPQGWVDVPTLLAALKTHGSGISLEQLEHIVATSDKKRFTLSEDGARIRAAQGHSVDVDIAVAAKVPPAVLYHGTAKHARRLATDAP